MNDAKSKLIIVPSPAPIDTLADEIEQLAARVRARFNQRDETQKELLEALNIAWLAAERWRFERSASLMQRINIH